MKNTLTDLNNYLFEALERINDDDLDEEGLDKEIKRAEATTKVATTIINNANVQLNAIQQHGRGRERILRVHSADQIQQPEGNH